jgi:hypothetical protein
MFRRFFYHRCGDVQVRVDEDTCFLGAEWADPISISREMPPGGFIAYVIRNLKVQWGLKDAFLAKSALREVTPDEVNGLRVGCS